MSEALLPLSVTQSFTYDAYDRLWTAGEGSGWSQTYNYDAYGVTLQIIWRRTLHAI
jgi:hypothetical protein